MVTDNTIPLTNVILLPLVITQPHPSILPSTMTLHYDIGLDVQSDCNFHTLIAPLPCPNTSPLERGEGDISTMTKSTMMFVNITDIVHM